MSAGTREEVESDLAILVAGRSGLIDLVHRGSSWPPVDRIACMRKLTATTADAFLAAFHLVMSRFAAAEGNPAALTPEMLAPNIDLLIITAELLHSAIQQLPHATVRVNDCHKVMADEAAQE
jgi:hypothetical protein